MLTLVQRQRLEKCLEDAQVLEIALEHYANHPENKLSTRDLRILAQKASDIKQELKKELS